MLSNGVKVVPGDVIFDTAVNPCSEADLPSPGIGCRLEDCFHLITDRTSRDQQRLSIRIISTRLGTVQWSENEVSVVMPLGSTLSFHAPSVGKKVIWRVCRVTRHFATGNIIAVDTDAFSSSWCQRGFVGMLRSDDIRPVLVGKDHPISLLQAIPASCVTSAGSVVLPAYLSFRPGDIVSAKVVSQLDGRQYQLSTMDEDCGCVEAVVASNGNSVKLVPFPGRRDIMINPQDGSEVFRWVPKL